MKKVIFCFLSIFFMSIFLSCTEASESSPIVNFDREQFSSSKGIWNESKLEKYSFSYAVSGDAGTLLQANVAVVGGVSSVTVEKVFNEEPTYYPEDVLEKQLKEFKDTGLYFTCIEDIFDCIDKIDRRNRDNVRKYPNHINSVTLSVRYGNKGIPVLIDTIWDAKEGLIGLDGPTISVTGFSFTE